MKTPYEYRAQARVALRNQWGDAAIAEGFCLRVAQVLWVGYR